MKNKIWICPKASQFYHIMKTTSHKLLKTHLFNKMYITISRREQAYDNPYTWKCPRTMTSDGV